MWTIKTKQKQKPNQTKNPRAHGYREQIGGWLRVEVGEGGLKVQIANYKMNKSWGCNVQHGNNS